MKEGSAKLAGVLSLLAAMIFVSGIILAAVFYFSGTVTPAKVSDLVKVLQGTLASPPEPVPPPAGQQPPGEPPKIDSQEDLLAAVAEWESMRSAQQEDLLTQAQAVESAARELETVRAEIDAREKDLQQREAVFAAAKAAEEAAASDQGFQEAVMNYSAMDAKDVAAMLYGLEDPVAVRYLRAFKTAFAAEVLTEFIKVDKQRQPGSLVNRAVRLQELISGGAVAPAAEAASAAD